MENIWIIIPLIIGAFGLFVMVLSIASKFIDAAIYIRAKIIGFYKQYKSLPRQRTHKK